MHSVDGAVGERSRYPRETFALSHSICIERNKRASEGTFTILDGVTTPQVPLHPMGMVPSPPSTMSPGFVFSPPNGEMEHDFFGNDDLLHNIYLTGQEHDLDLAALLTERAGRPGGGPVAGPSNHGGSIAADPAGDGRGMEVEVASEIEAVQSASPRPPPPPKIPPTAASAAGPPASRAILATPSALMTPWSTSDSASGSSGSDKWQGPMHIAARNGSDNIMRLLAGHGLDCNEKDSEGKTPLMLAVAGGFEEVVSTLLRSGARVDETDDELRNVLHLAMLHRRRDVLKALVAHAQATGDTAVTNAYDVRGQTPLHIAIDTGFEAGVHTLLLAGADVKRKAKRL